MPLDELRTTYRVIGENYRVGDDGSVWSNHRNTRAAVTAADGWHLIVGGSDKDGYRKVIICEGGKRQYWRVNMLVLTMFCGPPPSDMKNPTAAHANGVRTDNRLTNLRWATQKSNVADKKNHDTAQIGEKHPQCKLTNAKVLEIRKLRAAGITWREIAELLGEKLVTVHAAGSGRNWKHI